MADERLGLAESVSMAIGGMVGGGIFAVLGVVAAAAGPLSWLAFGVAGVIATCAGYSFVRLNALVDGPCGPITFIEHFTGSTKFAGMAGWTFVFGYVGTMAMYAYAFGGYFTELVGVEQVPAAGLPLRPAVSLAAVAGFVVLNLAGARASGRVEDVLVALKVGILLLFGLGGVYYAYTRGALSTGLAQFGAGPLVAAAISFVAFEGWELLLFDQGSIENPEETVRKAVYVSIFAATGLYVLVAVVTTNLVPPETIRRHSETALAIAARPFLGAAGFTLISLAALFSTGSAINATLFSAARLSRQLVSEDLLPHQIRTDGAQPTRAVLVLGALTGAFTFFGSLSGITSFASLAFISIFGVVSYLAFRQRSASPATWLVPAVGVVGAAGTVVALLYHLYTAEPNTFGSVVVVAVAVVAVELIYFERQPLASELEDVEDVLARFERDVEDLG